MAEVVLFHHIQGLTDGVRAFADELHAAGHTVHTPDLFDGEQPATIDEGVALTRSIGGELVDERADRAVADLPEGLVYACPSVQAQRSGSPRPGPARVARCFTSPASRLPASGPSGRGPKGFRYRSTAWTTTRSSRREGTSTPLASWSRLSAPNWPSCSFTRATGTCSSTARCRRTIPTRRRWRCNAPVSFSTGWPDTAKRVRTETEHP